VYTINETHDPARRSWLATANDPGTDFPIQNLPFGVFGASGSAPRIGVAIGEAVLDMPRLVEAGFLAALPAPVSAALGRPVLNDLMALGPQAWSSCARASATCFARAAAPRPPSGRSSRAACATAST
jgi:fumarylacetoacetase